MDIWQRLVTRDMPHGHLELLDRAADEIARLRAMLKDCQTAMEERWGAVGSPPHLLGQIRKVLEGNAEGICAFDAWHKAEADVASLTAEVMHLRDKLDKIAECARWNLEPKDQYPNQKPTVVRCSCGWRGETTALVESMGTHILHCPKCYRAADG